VNEQETRNASIKLLQVEKELRISGGKQPLQPIAVDVAEYWEAFQTPLNMKHRNSTEEKGEYGV
jgi:hypothetical protein